MMTRRWTWLALTATVGWLGSAEAAEVTLKATTALVADSQFGRIFTMFVDHVNQQGKGLVQIRMIGGPEAIPPFEQGTALKNGVIDMAHIPANYYENLMPEGTVTSLATVSPAEQKKNGAWEFLNALHNQKVNAQFYASYGWGIPFHMYVNRKVERLDDFKGMTLRATPGLQAFFQALGTTPVATAPGEIYTALERGVVDGYSWPLWGINDLGWQRVTKYRVDPGWTTVQANILINLDTWKKLTSEQRAFMDKTATWFDATMAKLIPERNAEEAKKQADAGIQVVSLDSADAKRYVQMVYDAAWAAAEKKSPENAPKLRALLTKQ
jgi:TRAP-type C4-dicarboxylate transport system substrate-binding protein